MKTILALLLLVISSNVYAMDATQSKQFVKDAVVYALENKDPNMDYGKYVSHDFVNPIDGKVFNYQQWVTHQKHIKAMVKSMTPKFDWMVADGDNVATIFYITIIKNNGEKLVVKDLAFFKINHDKVVYCEELTRLIKGNVKNKNIGSTK
ncbi:MAG TPA: hypothetical protein VGV92_04550 [Gammaproteobacteria bacterium]|nr:hypothetical protein [Gammaproteobacteria bacterium]